MRIYSELKYIFFDDLFDLNENISIAKILDSSNRFNFQSDKLGSFDVEFSIIENRYGMSYDSETKFESIFLNGSNLKTTTSVLQNTILNGGVNNVDEDVPQLIGGLNGISKNSNTINNG